uniref:Peptidase M14 domain-containing protein n=1 Tax=viral metagenome TaxID=1070528 RepID=A0A6C0EKE2_9ZZZZ
MEQYTLSKTNIKSIPIELIDKIDVDYCCKSNNNEILTIYAKKETMEEFKNKGYHFEKTDIPKIIKNKAIDKKLGSYHHQDDLEKFIKNICSTYPKIASYEIIGITKEKRNLFMTKITTNSDNNKPGFLIVGNIHGDETLGRELGLYLMDYLCKQYENNNPLIDYLINNTQIYILPSLNPDGFEREINGYWSPSRRNSNNVDLNRNFPDHVDPHLNISPEDRENEVNAIINWSAINNIHMSLSIHGGALVVNYPLDGPISGQYSKSEDDDFFKYISKEYVNNHSNFDSKFTNGITNGAQWYALYGGMQDWHYKNRHSFELTLELSDKKFVDESKLEAYWNDNKKSLINSIKLLHIGLRGYVVDGDNIGQLNIHNTKLNSTKNIELTQSKFFNIPLNPGSYILTYKTVTYNIDINYNYNYLVIIENNKIDITEEQIPGTIKTPQAIPQSIPQSIPQPRNKKRKKRKICVIL